jgi:hypothetical protein
MKESPLSKLVVSESQAINEQELADLLAIYVSLDKETKEIYFFELFRNLQNAEKILILLCAIKARKVVFGDAATDKISPTEIIKTQIMPGGSVKSCLKLLLDSREINADKGKYYLPNYKLPQIIARFAKPKS